MAKYCIESENLDAVAEAIKTKNGIEKDIVFPDGFISAVDSLARSRIYTGENTKTVVGTGEYIVLAKDDFLKEHRNDEFLFVRVKFDVEVTPYTVVENWAFNRSNAIPYNDGFYQFTHRYGIDGSASDNRIDQPVNTVSPQGVACVQITEDGELRIYSNSSANYAIRPSKYTAIIEW